MTLAAELQAALPRGVVVHPGDGYVRITAKHARGLRSFFAPEGPVDVVLFVVARELRQAVERLGPIAAGVVGEA